ncbi:MAG TPA: VOC family protein [Trueperaceae bacterium]|nr:VOC family protein [Trueperaceae bacterium]
MRSSDTYLNFDGNTMEAFEFYRSVIGGEFETKLTYAELAGGGWEPPEVDRGRIGHVSLRLSEATVLMGSDVSSNQSGNFVMGNNVYININAESEEEARRLFAGLSAGGKVEIALTTTGWAKLYGSFFDKFGVGWMVNLSE